MNEDENENQRSLDEERKKLKDLGVDSTWNILSSSEKKKKKTEHEDPPKFRGFK
jgi:hypothetical protein